MNATYTKLRDGSWGVRVQGEVSEGQSITVTKKSGSTKTEIIKAVLWSGNGITLCAIAQHTHSHRKSGCGCDDDCCNRGCRCPSYCNCQGGNVYDC